MKYLFIGGTWDGQFRELPPMEPGKEFHIPTLVRYAQNGRRVGPIKATTSRPETFVVDGCEVTAYVQEGVPAYEAMATLRKAYRKTEAAR